MKDLQEFRKEYKLGKLSRQSLTDDPIEMFTLWFEQAVKAKLPEPNAMTVATVDENQRPSQRIVLLKDIKPEGFVFYTNLGSNKAQDLASNSNISLHFPWYMMERQISISGSVEKLSRTDVAKYFLSRPKQSQLGAWASRQSQVISTKQLLLSQYERMKEKFANNDIPLPDFWGGYIVRPKRIEFWQGGEHRLHDRFEYTKIGDKWTISRLMP